MGIQNRKQDHVRLTAENQSAYSFGAGFDRWKLRHNALPELNIADVSTKAALLGRLFDFPVMISSMTGGYAGATQINAVIARACEKYNIPMGVGSQRAMLTEPELQKSFSIVREVAPQAFIAGNIGGAQLIGRLPDSSLDLLLGSIRADALIVHLNPLQELMQPEGDSNFAGILDGIQQLCAVSPVPVIIKETGAGIDFRTAKKLVDAGAKVIDIAGSGGTSWARVENLRQTQTSALHDFDDWGLTTTECLAEYPDKSERSFQVIASGGIRSAQQSLIALCLGADFTAIAQPVIAAVLKDSVNGLDRLLSDWHRSLQFGMLLTGTSQVSALNSSVIVPK